MSNTSQQYECSTQDGRMPTFGVAPALEHHDGHGDSIVLGVGSIIPRWDVAKQPNRKLQYFVRKDTFTSGDAAQLAASALQQAADEWNALKLGLTITSTNDQSKANFYLIYVRGEPDSTTFAQAFFPHEVNQDVTVFEYAFDPSNKSILKNVFLHELGHVLGLRHEFAVAAEGEGAVQFMQTNAKSVMSYTIPPTMQQSDQDGIKAFYKVKNGTLIDGIPVTDYMPQIRKKT